MDLNEARVLDCHMTGPVKARVDFKVTSLRQWASSVSVRLKVKDMSSEASCGQCFCELLQSNRLRHKQVNTYVSISRLAYLA
jgi:hypothetical protein